MKKKMFCLLLLLSSCILIAFGAAGCGMESGSNHKRVPHECEWGEWSITQEATCMEGGWEMRFCKIDPDEWERRSTEIDDTAHVFEEDICRLCGIKKAGANLLYETNFFHRNTCCVSGIAEGVEESSLSISDTYRRMPVTEIGNSAFEDDTNLESITIPSSIVTIGGGAFAGCTNLKSITIPSSVVTIGGSAFEGCTSLKSVTIPSNVEFIGGSAFANCTNLMSVVIEDGVSGIGMNAFENCSRLTTVEMGNSITYIGGYSFFMCTSLRSITIPSSVTEIEYSAFGGCFRLVEVINLSALPIQKENTLFGYAAHYAIDLYQEKVPENKFRQEGDFVFYEGEKSVYLVDYLGDETHLELPEKFRGRDYLVGNYAFYGRDTLKSVKIPEGTTALSGGMFSGCTSLEDISIPDSVTEIGFYAFERCTSLKNITLPNSIKTIKYCAFSGCTNLEEIVIPDHVEKIELKTFENCTNLKTVSMGLSLNWIVNDAFEGCTSLESVTFECVAGWRANGEEIDVYDPKKNAENLKCYLVWRRW